MGLTGRTVIVAGGGGGLGRACALELGQAGVHLALCDRDQALLDDTVATLTEAGATVGLNMVIDVREPDALRGFFEAVDATLGPNLHGLVNVVGGTFHQPFAESTPKGWDAIIRTNFTWLLHSIHLAIPRMRAAGGGSIVNLTSVEGHRAAPNYAVYGGMKAAVENFGRSLAVELAPEAIRVNTIAPDKVPTEAMARIAPVKPDPTLSAAAVAISTPMGDPGKYSDIGGSALFLMSDLSRFVTGTSLHPDGGVLASSGWFNWPGSGFLTTPPDDAVQVALNRERS